MVAMKINAMKDTKSPGVDGIPPKLLMETVEQISISLARLLKLSFAWNYANIIQLFKKDFFGANVLGKSEVSGATKPKD